MGSNDIAVLRDKLIKQKALSDNARANNKRIEASLREKLESIDPEMLETLHRNGFDVSWVAEIDLTRLGDADYMRELKRKNVESIGQISSFLEKYVAD